MRHREELTKQMKRNLFMNACKFLARLVAFVALSVTTQAASPTPILEYTFNDTSSTTVISSGSNTATGILTGTYGTGVSGSAGDYSFNNSAATGMGNSGTGGGVVLNTGSGLGGLESFTLVGWYNSSLALANNARLFDSATAGALTLYGSTAGALTLTVNNATATSAVSSNYTATNQWVFFAVTYISNGVAGNNNTNFYVGDTSGMSLVSTATLFTNNLPSTGNIEIGNSNNASFANARPYDGLMDNIRIFGSTSDITGALSLAQLDAIRAADAVPEPSSMALVALGCLSGLATVLRQRSRIS